MSETPTTTTSGPNQTLNKIYGDQRVKAMVEATNAGLGYCLFDPDTDGIPTPYERLKELDPEDVGSSGGGDQ